MFAKLQVDQNFDKAFVERLEKGKREESYTFTI